MSRADTYAKAAEVLKTNGWKKGSFVDGNGGRAVCLFGACFLADGYEVKKIHPYDFIDSDRYDYYALDQEVVVDYEDKYPELVEIVHTDINEDFDPATYNDLPNTTLEDILLILKKAEAKARKSEEGDDDD